MLVTWKYRPRNTFIQRLDSRTRFIFMACIVLALTVPEIWDYRIVFSLFLLSLTLYLMARIPWKDVRRAWIYIFFLVFFIVGINAVLFGRGGPSSVNSTDSPIVFLLSINIPFTELGWEKTITVARLWFGVNQIVRMLTMAMLALPFPYTLDPNIYGITFKRMGVSDKISFTMDLAFRFLPTFARDLSITIDAQRARGYEVEKLSGGVVARLQRLAPLIIPVTMQSTVTGEEVIDAMDLRAFGTSRRTWLKELHFARRDYLMIGFGIAIFIGCCVLKWVYGVGGFIVPDFFSNLFI